MAAITSGVVPRMRAAIGISRIGYRVVRIDAELVRRDLTRAVALVRTALGKPP